MTSLEQVLAQERFSRTDIVRLLSTTDPGEADCIRKRAQAILLHECGPAVYYRGLIEFSNQCVNDCLYCGIRAGNRAVRRYQLTEDEIVEGIVQISVSRRRRWRRPGCAAGWRA